MSRTRPTILVVDDSLTVRMGLRDALLRGDLQVDVAASLGEAEASLGRSPFSLVILDLQLPDGEGMPFLRRLTSGQFGKAMPVLVISGSDKLESRLEALKFGADFVAKPYSPHFVLERVCSTLGRPAPESPGDRSCRVLIIDDSATYGHAVAAELRKDGHDVVLAATAAEGSKYLGLQKPDRILLDVFLPDADGIDVARQIRTMAGGRDMPLLLLTGRESATTRKRAAQAGVTDFLTKDSALADLRAWVIRPSQSSVQRARENAPPAESGPAHSRPSASRASTANLFDQLVAASGLSKVLGRSTLELALRRSGAEPDKLTRDALARSLEQIEKTLTTFLPPEVVRARMSSIVQLAQEDPHVIIAK